MILRFLLLLALCSGVAFCARTCSASKSGARFCRDDGKCFLTGQDPFVDNNTLVTCPEYAGAAACCSEETANATVGKYMQDYVIPIFNKCPQCVENFRKLYCAYQCSPRNSDFTDVLSRLPESSADKPKDYPRSVRLHILDEYCWSWYHSCKDANDTTSYSHTMGEWCRQQIDTSGNSVNGVDLEIKIEREPEHSYSVTTSDSCSGSYIPVLPRPNTINTPTAPNVSAPSPPNITAPSVTAPNVSAPSVTAPSSPPQVSTNGTTFSNNSTISNSTTFSNNNNNNNNNNVTSPTTANNNNNTGSSTTTNSSNNTSSSSSAKKRNAKVGSTTSAANSTASTSTATSDVSVVGRGVLPAAVKSHQSSDVSAAEDREQQAVLAKHAEQLNRLVHLQQKQTSREKTILRLLHSHLQHHHRRRNHRTSSSSPASSSLPSSTPSASTAMSENASTQQQQQQELPAPQQNSP